MHQAPCSDISMVRAHIKDAHLEPVVGQLRSDLRAVDVPCMHTCNFRPPARALKWDSFLITLRASAVCGLHTGRGGRWCRPCETRVPCLKEPRSPL